MIVITRFKFVLRRPKVVLCRICSVYLRLIHKTILETVPVHWTACFVSAITHSSWLFKALEKEFVVMLFYFPYFAYTAVTQLYGILIKYFMIFMMFRKVLYNKLHKDLSYICLDMATVWRFNHIIFLFRTRLTEPC